MTQKRGLGRGFESIIPAHIDPQYDPAATQAGNYRTQNVLISDINPNPKQPRKNFSEQQINELASSIKQHGVLQPIILVRARSGYLLIAGERRVRAAKVAGLTEIPALVRSLTEQAQLEVALIENLQREDLSPLEMATALAKLNQEFNQSYEKIAASIGKASTTVINIIRLLNLPNPAKLALARGQITEGHARQILALKDSKKQQELLDLIVRHSWTVRRAEQFVIAVKEGSSAKTAVQATFTQTPQTKKIGSSLGTEVRLQKMAKGGRLIIRYKDSKQLDDLTEKITNLH
jgi:ParB family chromosome partitioning protein